MLTSAAVLQILNTAWDPIGLSGLEEFDPEADREYAGYAQELTSMLARGAGTSGVSDYLRWAEEHMGLDPSPQRIQAVTDLLLAARDP